MLTPRQLETVEKKFMKRVLSAILFAVTSFVITLVNKQILLENLFLSYHILGLCQIALTIVVLRIGRHLQLMQFPMPERSVMQRIWPLPLLLLGNFLTGFGNTTELSLPMYNVLRRITLLMTMMLEKIVLGAQTLCSVQASVIAIFGGAAISAADNVTFSLMGCTYVVLNDAFLAAKVVYVKKLLDSKELNTYGLLYYNSLFMFIPALCVAHYTDDLYMATTFEYWNESLFVGYFIISCVLDVILSYSVVLCIQYNGALTTSILVSLKSFILTYIDMIVVYDYLFSWPNFVGWNISVLASLVYLYGNFKDKTTPTYALFDKAKVETA